MNRTIYTAMNAANLVMQTQAVKANNLANISTPGFKGELDLRKFGGNTDSNSHDHTLDNLGWDFSQGAMIDTDKELDCAITGKGWFAVRGLDGEEGYTRRGDFQLDSNRNLVNGAGDIVLGNGGPINIGPAKSVFIGDDGTISIEPLNSSPGTKHIVDRLKLVNPKQENLLRKENGLFGVKSGTAADVDLEVKVKSKMLESSNVNAVGEMVDIIALARKYELKMKMIDNTKKNDEASAKAVKI